MFRRMNSPGCSGPDLTSENARIRALLGQVPRVRSLMNSTHPTAPISDTAAVPGEPLLVMVDVYHRWKGPKPPVLDEVSLTLRAGEVTWIGGRNGAGKTTLLRLAAGILLPQRGTVRIGELSSEDRGNSYQRQIGFLSAGDRSLQARMRVTQQLDYWARLAYVPREQRRERVDLCLKGFGLEEFADRRVDRMSMGQRQRIRLAMAFLHEPSVILLDEPRNSLDDDGYELLNTQTRLATARGATMLWCSPRGEDRVIDCDQSFSLGDGRLERVG
jgi:ABC-type multidrug transport system ATPase subunit